MAHQFHFDPNSIIKNMPAALWGLFTAAITGGAGALMKRRHARRIARAAAISPEMAEVQALVKQAVAEALAAQQQTIEAQRETITQLTAEVQRAHARIDELERAANIPLALRRLARDKANTQKEVKP